MSARALFLDVWPPQPDRYAASRRSHQLMQLLRSRGLEVDFAALQPPDARDGAGVLRALGVRPLPWCAPSERRSFLARHAADYDVVVLVWAGVAARFVDAVRRAAPEAFIVFDAHEVVHVHQYRHARVTGDRRLLARALRSRTLEARVVASADRTLAVSEADAEVLRDVCPGAAVSVVTMWHEPAARANAPAAPTVLFVGYYGAPHNQDAARQLALEILPRLRRRVPEASLVLAGSEPPGAITDLAADGVEVPGWLPDLAPLYATASVFVAPLRFGSGIKVKLLQAMAHGTPIVASAVAAEGTGLVHGRDYWRAETPEDVAAACAALIADRSAARALGESARRHLAAAYSRGVVERQFEAALAGAADREGRIRA